MASEHGGALAKGLLIKGDPGQPPTTSLSVYAILNFHDGQYVGTVQFKGWVSKKTVNGMWNVGSPTFHADTNTVEARGNLLWKGQNAVLVFRWLDVADPPENYKGLAWWEIRNVKTNALLFGSGLEWPTDHGVNVELAHVEVRQPS